MGWNRERRGGAASGERRGREGERERREEREEGEK